LTLEGHTHVVTDVCFSPDGKNLASGGFDQTVGLWDVTTGQLLNTLRGHSVPGHIEKGISVAFRKDGRVLAGGGTDGMLILWDPVTGAEISRFTSHTGAIASVQFNPGGDILAVGSNDATASLWDVSDPGEPQMICRFYSFPDGSWAVLDEEGRYDASDGGDIEWMHWVVGLEPVALSQLKERYYEPGLLPKLFGFSSEPLRDVPSLTEVRLYPEIELVSTGPTDPETRIRLIDQGGGIGRVTVSINGKEMTADARGGDFDLAAGVYELQLDLSDHPFLIPGQENVCEVRAYNAEGYLVSRSLRAPYVAPETELDPPHLWAILVGTSDYQGNRLDLHFAAKDAEDMAEAIQLGAVRLLGADKVHTTLLTAQSRPATQETGQLGLPDSAEWDQEELISTRKNVIKAFESARAAKSTDILLVYMAGHGVNHGGQDGDYYYLTADARTGNLRDPAVRQQTAISSRELTECIREIPALKQVLILDTCAAGRLVERLTEHRAIESSQIRALDRMKDRTGLHILAGSTADAVSYESSRYGQGLLTYSMLLGMQGAALREDEFLDISRLFEFAADQVPELAKDIGGIQRPLTATPRGGASFDIGRLTAADRQQIPLARVRPLVLRASLEDEDTWQDHLELSKRINGLLRERSARGREAPLIFVDAGGHAGAYELKGRYRVEDDSLKIGLRILCDRERIASYQIEGDLSNLEELAKGIVQTMEDELDRQFERGSS
jgi:uncharacterized caspase-like protein